VEEWSLGDERVGNTKERPSGRKSVAYGSRDQRSSFGQIPIQPEIGKEGKKRILLQVSKGKGGQKPMLGKAGESPLRVAGAKKGKQTRQMEAQRLAQQAVSGCTPEETTAVSILRRTKNQFMGVKKKKSAKGKTMNNARERKRKSLCSIPSARKVGD